MRLLGVLIQYSLWKNKMSNQFERKTIAKHLQDLKQEAQKIWFSGLVYVVAIESLENEKGAILWSFSMVLYLYLGKDNDIKW